MSIVLTVRRAWLRCGLPMQAGWLAVMLQIGCSGLQATDADGPRWWGPTALLVTPDANRLCVAAERGQAVLVVDTQSGATGRLIPLGQPVTGLAPTSVRDQVLVTCSGSTNAIYLVDVERGDVLQTWNARPGVCSPVTILAQGRFYVCNRFEHTVGIHDLASGCELSLVKVLREPVAAALSAGGDLLAVANSLPEGAASAETVAAAVTLVDTAKAAALKHIRLPNGSTEVMGMAASPGGDRCAVVHNLARFQIPTTQVEHGWMNVSALSLIDLEAGGLVATVLLDEPRRGAANPWAVAWNADGSQLVVAHAGTHEVSVIDAREMERRMAAGPQGKLVGDLDFFRGLRQRVPLTGNGPRCLTIAGSRAYVAGFFSDTLHVLDLVARTEQTVFRLGPGAGASPANVGERLFHDATISHQSWQSCASCHPDGRADGLNWDLTNDGLGNPKNTKSLLLSSQTPPAMSLGVRMSTREAVRSGLRRILFSVRKEEDARALDAYIEALRPVPSPLSEEKASTPAIERGRVLFASKEVGCAACHPGPLFTDLKPHDVGTVSQRQPKEKKFDTPTLVECWRTAPYLHDGSAVTLRDVLTTANPTDQHGHTSHLTPAQLDDLVAYVRSL